MSFFRRNKYKISDYKEEFNNVLKDINKKNIADKKLNMCYRSIFKSNISLFLGSTTDTYNIIHQLREIVKKYNFPCKFVFFRQPVNYCHQELSSFVQVYEGLDIANQYLDKKMRLKKEYINNIQMDEITLRVLHSTNNKLYKLKFCVLIAKFK